MPRRANYFVTGLPRSRTAWFAAYLTAQGGDCIHEGLTFFSHKADFDLLMSKRRGLSDPGLMFTDFQERFSGAGSRTVIIHREINEVRKSLKRLLVNWNDQFLLDAQARMKGLNGLHVPFEQIDARLKDITNYLGVEYDAEIAASFKNMVITVKCSMGDPQSLALWVN